MQNKNRPAIDPAYYGSLQGVIEYAFNRLMMENINGVLPAKVIKYDRDTNRVQIQILINTVGTSGEQVAGPQISDIPVYIMGGANLMISFPLNEGDLGWVIACDRDISIFLQKYEAAGPSVDTIKNFSGSFFLPDLMTNYSIADEDSQSLVIQNRDGSVKIAVSQDKVSITSPNIEISGDTQLTGNLFVVGDIQATGSITPDVPPP